MQNNFFSNNNSRFDVINLYKGHILFFLKFTALLVFIGFFERSVFTIYHHYLTTAYSSTEIIYTLLWGLRFDLALAGGISLISVFITYFLERFFTVRLSISLKYLAYIFGSIIFLLQGADIIYFTDASRHIGYEITDVFTDAKSLLATAWTVYKSPFLLHLFLYPVLLFIIFILFRKSDIPVKKLYGLKKLHLEGTYISLLFIFLIMGRGGFQSIPLEPLHAQEISDSTKASLALNGAYNAIYYLFNKKIISRVYINLPDTLDINGTLKKMYPRDIKTNSTAASWRPNIIFILLESWPSMYMKSYGYDKEVTPFFDGLRKKSLTSLEMIAGGHRTTEGMFSSFCSAQNPLGQTIAQSQLQEYHYECLPHILRKDGYTTAFFQGTNKNTSGTGAFAQLLGFSESFGKRDISKRNFNENYWGVYDQDLYRYIYQSLKTKKSPVLFGINTNTTHDIKLPKGIAPHFNSNKDSPKRLNTLFFADSALKDFFNKVENDPEIGDTLWVIVADHTAGLKTSRLNNYRIPFLIYHKNKILPQLVNRAASQRDISPTVLSILGRNIPETFTGKSLTSNDNTPYFADYYHAGILGWIEDNWLLEIPLSAPDKISCYDYLTDKLQKSKLPCPASTKQYKNNALSFTQKSQSLLFNGKSGNWAN